MNRYLHDVLVWILIVFGAFCLATIALFFVWWVLLPKFKANIRGGVGRIHAAAWTITTLGALLVNGLQRALSGVTSTFLWAYVVTPVLCGLPIIASYFGLLLARKRRGCNGVSPEKRLPD